MTAYGSSDVSEAAKAGEFRRLKESSAFTVDELREFLAKMRGKSPQEVLGLVASSDLLRATVQATIGCIVLLALMTVGPYYLYSGAKPAKDVGQKPQPTAAQPAAAATPPAATAETEKKPDVGSTANAAATNPNQPNLEKAAKKMGMDETKVTDPKKNPLENNLDKLLDKLE